MAEQITEVLMPLMGEGVNEATLVRWLKKVGDKVEKAEPLLEVSTDKVDTEIPAPSAGYLLQTNATEGAQVEVNSVLAVLGATADTKIPSGSVASAPKKAAAKAATAATPDHGSASIGAAGYNVPSTQFSGTGGRLRSSPLVRKMAQELSVDLGTVHGTGLGGRINKYDLLSFVDRRGGIEGGAGGGGAAHAPVIDKLEVTKKDGKEFLEGVPVRREKMTKMRQLIAEHMVRSVRVSPHVTTTFEIDVHRIAASLEKHKAAFLKREGFKLTYTAYFIHAAVQAIKQHPIVNCSVDGDDILHKDQINVGCAVAIPTGLIVPVIKNAGDLSLSGIASKLNDLVTRARNKKLLPEDVQGGTFSITNPGGWGSITSNPIINQPQVAMLGIGAVVKRPVVIDDSIAIRPMMMMSLTFDHRVVDGEGGAKYLATIKEIIENYNDQPM